MSRSSTKPPSRSTPTRHTSAIMPCGYEGPRGAGPGEAQKVRAVEVQSLSMSTTVRPRAT
eukprot:2511806-Pyramimonas_sp.AAC.1